jgi:hypothetical protein
MTNDLPRQKPAKEGMESAGEFLKFTLGLATGAMVFSLGLAKVPYTSPGWSVALIVATWVTLAVCIVGGVLTMARIPILLAEGNYDLEDSHLVWPWRVHQVAFGAAMVCLSIVLVRAVFVQAPSTPGPRVTPGVSIPVIAQECEVNIQVGATCGEEQEK